MRLEEGTILSRGSPNDMVPIRNSYFPLYTRLRFSMDFNQDDPAAYVDVQLTVHGAERRNVLGGIPTCPGGSPH